VNAWATERVCSADPLPTILSPGTLSFPMGSHAPKRLGRRMRGIEPPRRQESPRRRREEKAVKESQADPVTDRTRFHLTRRIEPDFTSRGGTNPIPHDLGAILDGTNPISLDMRAFSDGTNPISPRATERTRFRASLGPFLTERTRSRRTLADGAPERK
jgi:hypothetical protein